MTESDQIIVSSRALEGVVQRIFKAGLILNMLHEQGVPELAGPLEQVLDELDSALRELRLARIEADTGTEDA